MHMSAHKSAARQFQKYYAQNSKWQFFPGQWTARRIDTAADAVEEAQELLLTMARPSLGADQSVKGGRQRDGVVVLIIARLPLGNPERI